MADKAWRGALATALPLLLPGPYLLLHFFLVAETKHLSPYALPNLCQVPYATFSPCGPNLPGSGEEGFRNQPAFFTPCPGMTIFRPHHLVLNSDVEKPVRPETTKVPSPGWWTTRRGRKVLWSPFTTKLFATEHIKNYWGFFCCFGFLWKEKDIDHYLQRYKPKLLNSDDGESL